MNVRILTWLSDDGRLILAARIIRTFGYGFLSVILSIYLALIGFNGVQVGLILSTSLLNGILFNVIASYYADRLGRRNLLIIYSLLMFSSGIIFFVTDNYIALIVAAFVGTINVTGSETSAFLSIEQAILPRTIKDIKKRNMLFALYNLAGTLSMSAGILLSGLPTIVQQYVHGLSLAESMKILFLIYSLLGIASILIYLRLSKDIEVTSTDKRSPINGTEYKYKKLNNIDGNNGNSKNNDKGQELPQDNNQEKQLDRTFKVSSLFASILSPKSKQIVTKLSALFAIDSFAGGFVIQSIVSLWFYARFGADLSTISYILSISGVVTAFSFMAAARIADRIGLINTMVFTHLPANILIIVVAFAPTLPIAAILYLIRMALSQMDVPTRQSYIVSVVKDEERTAATGITNISRNVSQALSPSLAGYIIQSLSLFFVPFLIGGVLKVIYDIFLYFSFRNIKPQQEEHDDDDDDDDENR
jgi:MFS family permease